MKKNSKPAVEKVVETKPVQKPATKNLPVQKFRSGALQATVWGNEITSEEYGTKTVYSFNITRSYKDKNDEWQETTSFRKQDVGAIHMLTGQLATFLLLDEDEEQDTE